MNLLSNKKSKIVFFTKNSSINSEDSMNLVLSPEFYWIRSFHIPVTSEKKALKLLPSLFDDILPHNNFDYFVIKQDINRFICFAYDHSKILKTIKNSGLKLNQIESIYFAQNELLEYPNFSFDGDNYSYIDDILTKIPAKMNKDLFDGIKNQLDQANLSKYKIPFKLYETPIKSNIQNKIILIFLILTCINIYAIINHNSTTSKIEQEIKQIKEKYALPNSIIEAKSIINNYQDKINKQVILRDSLYDVLNTPQFHKGDFTHINLDNNVIKIHLNPERIKDIKLILKQKTQWVITSENVLELKL